MKLKATYARAEDVPEAQKDFYVEKDGKWLLDAEGVEDVSGLKNALSGERDAVKLLKAQLAELAPLKERAAEMEAIQAKLDEIEDGELLKHGKAGLEKILEKRTRRTVEDAAAKIKAADEAKAASDALAKDATVKLRNYHLTSEVTKAATKAGIRGTAFRDVTRAAAEVFEVGEDMSLTPRDTLTDKKGNPVTLETWFSDVLADEAPHYWEKDVGGGGRGGGGPAGSRILRSDQKAMNENFERIARGEVTVIDG